MGWPSRADTIRQMGLDDTQWKEASELQDMLSTLKHQRESNPDVKDVKGELTGFSFASRSMFRYTFHTVTEPYYDRRRKCLWYLGRRVSFAIDCSSFLTKAGTKGTRIS
jgi:phosphoribosyl-AMP cyclohydrolase